MGVYSSIDIYPSEFDEEFVCQRKMCHNCTFDCKHNHNTEYYSGDEE